MSFSATVKGLLHAVCSARLELYFRKSYRLLGAVEVQCAIGIQTTVILVIAVATRNTAIETGEKLSPHTRWLFQIDDITAMTLHRAVPPLSHLHMSSRSKITLPLRKFMQIKYILLLHYMQLFFFLQLPINILRHITVVASYPTHSRSQPL